MKDLSSVCQEVTNGFYSGKNFEYYQSENGGWNK